MYKRSATFNIDQMLQYLHTTMDPGTFNVETTEPSLDNKNNKNDPFWLFTFNIFIFYSPFQAKRIPVFLQDKLKNA